MKTHRKLPLGAILPIGLLLMSSAASASNWSAVATTCAVDESDINAAEYLFSLGTVKFATDKTGDIGLRCMVSNPMDVGNPTWTTIKIGCQDPDGSGGLNYSVQATLKRVKSDGTISDIRTVDCNFNPAVFSHTFDFLNNTYYVALTLKRNVKTENPSIWAVQLR